MADSSPPRGPARETRLLLLTLLVSVAVLFLLARFRFPERPLTDLSPPQPLARLARGTAFDELSGSLTELLRRFEASVVVLRVVSTTPGGAGGPGTIRLVPALRVRDDLALAPLSRDDRPIGVGDGQGSAAGAGASGGSASSGSGGADAGGNASGGSTSGGTASGGGILPANAVVARDERRGLAMVRVPARQAPPLLATPANEPNDLPGYVAVLEASPSGAIIRAEFVSSLSRASRRGWDAPAILVGGVTHAQPGALLFSLTGRFIGMALPDAAPGAVIVAPGDAVLAQVERLARGESLRLARPGFEVQPLTAALARATGAAAGVMVSAIATPGSPLGLGDVITTADGQPIRSTGDWQQALQRAAARGSARSASAAGSAPSGAASTTPAASAAAAASARGAAGATAPGTGPGSASSSGSGSGSGQPGAPAKSTAPPAASPGAATGAAGGPVTMKLEVVRFGQTLQVTLPLAMSEAPDDVDGARGAAAAGAAGSAAAAAPGSSLGATFRPAAGGTLDIVSVTPAGPAARAGLRPGDRVTALLPARGPLTAARLAAAFGALKSRDALVLAVNRPDGAAIVSVDRP